MFIFSKNKIFLILLVVVFIFSYSVFPKNITALGISAGPLMPFGGMVYVSYYCDCSFNFLLTIGPPSNIQLMYDPLVPQYDYSQLPRAGVWALGLYTPVGVCTVYSGTHCNYVGAPIGTISSTVGTSL